MKSYLNIQIIKILDKYINWAENKQKEIELYKSNGGFKGRLK